MYKAVPSRPSDCSSAACSAFSMRPGGPAHRPIRLCTVITRGSNLTGLDMLLVSTAQASFSYLVVGAILGSVAGVVIAMMTAEGKPSTTCTGAGARWSGIRL